MQNYQIPLILLVSSSLILPILCFDDSDGVEIETLSSDKVNTDHPTEIIQMFTRSDRMGKPNPKPQDKRFTSQVVSAGFFPQPPMLPPSMMQPAPPPSFGYPYYPGPALPPSLPVYPPMQQSFWPGYYYYDGFDMIMLRNGRKKVENGGNSQSQQNQPS